MGKAVTLKKNKPSYKKLILKALRDSPNSARKGTSAQFISKYIQERYETPDDQVVRRYISKRLKEMQEENEVAMIRRSYRLTVKGRKLIKGASKKTKKAVKAVRKAVKNATKRKITKGKTAKNSKTAKTAKTAKRAKTPKKSSRVRKSNSSEINNESSTNLNPEYIWQFYDNGFFNYDFKASEAVEDEYQKYLQSPGSFDVRSVKSGMFNYFIDFRQFTQQNIDHPNHTVRKIRRVKFGSNPDDVSL